MNSYTNKKQNLVPLSIFILVSVVFTGLFFILFGELSKQMNTPYVPDAQEEYYSELKTEIIKEGSGDITAKAGDSISVHYTGTFKDGSVFDSSLSRGEPFPFTLGQNEVIEGWDEGIIGMKVGEKRKLYIPYSMAYGEQGYNTIPAKADLIFEVELLEIK